MKLLELLTEKGLLNEQTASTVRATAEKAGTSLEAALLEQGVAADALLTTLGEYYQLPTRAVGANPQIPADALAYLSEDSARHYKLLPLGLKDGVMEVGTVNPDDLAATEALNFIAAERKIPYRLVVILERDLEHGLALYDNLVGEVDVALTELEDELSVGPATGEESTPEVPSGAGATAPASGEEHLKEDAPVIKIVATILRYAVDGRASDIHIEPVRKKVIVRFRVDGVLQGALELPRRIHSAMVARVKILTSMRLDERRKPQDGRFSATIDERKIDFRVSTLPTYHGEKVVMRILDPESGVRTLEDTGISPRDLALIREAVQAPYGIILISGPTGSGKSTTLYGMLQEVDRAGKNVISLEDPVEYNIEGVSQSNVRPEIGYTFASGLRSVLRQDPDVIMVGEIRDKETAQLAIQAALTGHLVLSTIHTNNAIGVVPRLIDMGVDPYLIAPTLVLALAQRLVRRICPEGAEQLPVEGSLKSLIGHELKTLPEGERARVPKVDYVLEAASSPECPTGTRGRIAVMETLEIDDTLQELILKSSSEDQIFRAARANGFVTMKEDAVLKALAHEIPWSEVNTLGSAALEVEEQPEDAAAAAPAAADGVPAGESASLSVDNPTPKTSSEDV